MKYGTLERIRASDLCLRRKKISVFYLTNNKLYYVIKSVYVMNTQHGGDLLKSRLLCVDVNQGLSGNHECTANDQA